MDVNGGSGADYTFIQEGVYAAGPGDTLFVREGVYYENLLIDRETTLIGETRDATIVMGDAAVGVFQVVADGVGINGFTIQQAEGQYGGSGIVIHGDNIVITNNSIRNTRVGIDLESSSNCVISENIIGDNNDGITLVWSCTNNRILGNTIFNL